MLAAIGFLLLAPPVLLLRRCRPRDLSDPRLAAAIALAVALLLWSIDDLFNAMTSPFFPAISGALLEFLQRARRTARAGRTRAPVLLDELASAHAR
jgi:hypothetical protein